MAKEIRLIGFNFTKISAERNPTYDGKIETKSLERGTFYQIKNSY